MSRDWATGRYVTVRPGRHIAVQQGIGQQRAGRSELRRQLSAQAADISLDPAHEWYAT
jgi:hypothetical protein